MQNVTDTIMPGTPKDTVLPSFLVTPINDIGEALKKGHYSGQRHCITEETVRLKTADGQKRVYVVSFHGKIGDDEYVSHLTAKCLRPCVDGPNYLLGLMTQMPESAMPTALRGKNIVAAEPDNPSSVFLDDHKQRCFLCVHRHILYRIPGLVGVSGGWGGRWAFLAEEA